MPEPLSPPVPAGVAPDGIPVGHLDTGVNYLLPEIAARLARDREGGILGYDFADLSRRPFDVAPASDPFFPDRHGTKTASVLLDQAPVAALAPYRYPRGEMARLASLIEDAAAQGVRVMNVSMASRNRDQWLAFEEAARRHPEILFVVAAGNHGADLDRQPAYPAALAFANKVVVTSATAGGRLSHGVNWGRATVDLMVHGEGITALGFDGQRRAVSGSSYAAARVSALAACLLADRPDQPAAEFKEALLRKARPDDTARVATGFIPNATLDGRCHQPDLARAG